MLTLRQLRYFTAVARLRHFGRAADECAVSQPALSLQVQDLEATLGGPLLERGRGGVRLTPLGEEVDRRARTILLAAQAKAPDNPHIAANLALLGKAERRAKGVN